MRGYVCACFFFFLAYPQIDILLKSRDAIGSNSSDLDRQISEIIGTEHSWDGEFGTVEIVGEGGGWCASRSNSIVEIFNNNVEEKRRGDLAVNSCRKILFTIWISYLKTNCQEINPVPTPFFRNRHFKSVYRKFNDSLRKKKLGIKCYRQTYSGDKDGIHACIIQNREKLFFIQPTAQQCPPLVYAVDLAGSY